jgi:hypothetical protein
MNNRAQYYKSELDRLYAFLKLDNDGQTYTPSEIRIWVGECTSIFLVLNLPDTLVNKFLQSFDSKNIDYDNGGAFMRLNGNPDYIYRTGFRDRLYYFDLVFKVAFEIVNQLEEQNRFVPKYLIELIRNIGNTTLESLLDELENAYTSLDGQKLITTANSIVDLLLDLQIVLKAKRNLGSKLTTLIDRSNSIIRSDFGDESQIMDIAIALNNSRVIRNTRMIHPHGILSTSISSAQAISYSSLVILFLEITLSTGKLLK